MEGGGFEPPYRGYCPAAAAAAAAVPAGALAAPVLPRADRRHTGTLEKFGSMQQATDYHDGDGQSPVLACSLPTLVGRCGVGAASEG